MSETTHIQKESETFDSVTWLSDGIQLGHVVSTFRELRSFSASGKNDVVRLHFGLKGNYSFNYKQHINKMKKNLTVKNDILIHASSASVWDALVNPEQTKKYMFGCETVSDWKVGSPLLWKGNYEGKEMVFVKGNIVEINPGKLLAYTTFDPNASWEDIPENYVTVTYDLSEENGHTKLTVTQGDFANVVDGEKRYQETYNNGDGWNPILLQIKTLVEADNS